MTKIQINTRVEGQKFELFNIVFKIKLTTINNLKYIHIALKIKQ
jgi:hypothetical protein